MVWTQYGRVLRRKQPWLIRRARRTTRPVSWTSAIGAGLAVSAILLSTPIEKAGAEPRWFQCTAWGGSHTGRYTFRIDVNACQVYWKQIDRHLETESCDGVRVVAIKPFAPAKGYVLHFNLENGAFSDHVPGWADRGTCRPVASG